MKEGKASYTAELVAIDRAVESIKPERQRVCYDPLAVHFLSTRYRVIAKSHLLTRFAFWWLRERHVPGAVGEAVARTKFIDDYLAKCIDDGIEQLVILGAGYDSRAYRFKQLRGKVKVFEVDHPDTQRVKIQKVKKVFGSLPDYVVYVALDLNERQLGEVLFENSYDKNKRTLFIWEGVTVYLAPEAVDKTLAFVANYSGEGSSVIFDYAFQSTLDPNSECVDAKKWQAAYERRGEPPRFGINEGAVEKFLTKRGFFRVESVSMEFLKKTYFKGVNEKRHVTNLGGVVHAIVARKSPPS